MKILLTGAQGQLGSYLRDDLGRIGKVFAFDRQTLDLCDKAEISSVLQRVSPRLIVNAAAYTQVDLAETEVESARAVNTTAVGQMADYAAEHSADLVHFSTDYVFPGNATRPIVETDQTKPLGIYGKTKLAGENAVIQSGCKHLVLRTSWVFSARGKNFLKTILKLAQTRDKLTIVNDQIGTPTNAATLSQLTTAALGRWLGRPGKVGIFNLSSTGPAISWYEFASYFLQQAYKFGIVSKLPTVEPVPSTAYPTPAQRPAYSVLDNSHFSKTFSIDVPDWRTQTDACIAEIAQLKELEKSDG